MDEAVGGNEAAARGCFSLLISAEFFVLMSAVYFGAGVRFFDKVEPLPFTFSSLFPEAGTFTFVMILSWRQWECISKIPGGISKTRYSV